MQRLRMCRCKPTRNLSDIVVLALINLGLGKAKFYQLPNIQTCHHRLLYFHLTECWYKVGLDILLCTC